MMTSMDDFFNIAVPRAYLGVSQFVKLSLTFPNGYWWFGLVLLGAFLDLFVQLFTFFICYIHILGLGCISMSMWCRALTPDKYHRQPWHVPKCGCDASYFLPRIWYMLRYVCFFSWTYLVFVFDLDVSLRTRQDFYLSTWGVSTPCHL